MQPITDIDVQLWFSGAMFIICAFLWTNIVFFGSTPQTRGDNIAATIAIWGVMFGGFSCMVWWGGGWIIYIGLGCMALVVLGIVIGMLCQISNGTR